MQQSAVTPAATVQDSAEQFARRRRTALCFTLALLFLSVVILIVGLVSTTRTDNVAVAGYYPGIVLSFGAFLGIVAINLQENRKAMLLASIIFVSIGVITTFFCAVIDGVIAADFIDSRLLLEGGCEYYVSLPGYGNYQTEVPCYNFGNKCEIRVKNNTCYCCNVQSCESLYHSQFYQYTGVSGCSDVVHLYRLLWSSVVLNILGLFLGIVTTAVLGAFKDITLTSQTSASSAPPLPPHILYNPTQHLLTFTGYCPTSQALPAYPNCPLPLQHHSSFRPPSTAPQCPEAPTSHVMESQPPSQPFSQASSSSCLMLTPNAPALYGLSCGPFEKPPAYAS